VVLPRLPALTLGQRPTDDATARFVSESVRVSGS
jgi:hypothetical protein